MRARQLVFLCLLGARGASGESALPLPDGPVRLVIADPAAFDGALSGAFKDALSGKLGSEDPVVAAFRQSPVGSKLEAQWGKLAADLPWTWSEIRKLRPSRLGLALLGVGNLEAVIVIDTPLAALPTTLPAGTTKAHGQVPYHLVSRGAADDGSDPGRRMGLVWAKRGTMLYLATSERAMGLALDASGTIAAPLTGLVSLDLDLDALAHDRYFRREFVAGTPMDHGHIHAALRLESGNLVEIREGTGEAGSPALAFDAPGAAAAGWEPDGGEFFGALRGGLLEPIPTLLDAPVPSLLPLPVVRTLSDDRLLVNLEKPKATQGQPPSERGELDQWKDLLASQPIAGWGYLLGHDGARLLVFQWPHAQDERLFALCRASVERRAGPSSVRSVGDIREIRVGPDLPALALRRTGDSVWIGASAEALGSAPVPRPAGELVRWATLDLDSVRAQGERWKKAEGPSNPERIRPFADRVLGLLGWMPKTRSLSVERRKTKDGWAERIVLGAALE